MSLYPANPTGLPARRAALQLLDAVLRRGEPLESALHAATQGLGQRADRALTHAIVAAVLRYMPALDALIDAPTRQPLPEDAQARAVLRISLAPALILTTPPPPALSTAPPLSTRGTPHLAPRALGTLRPHK